MDAKDYSGYATLQVPPLPKWKMTLADSDEFRFFTQNAPNSFHRWMQRVLLGIVWVRVNKESTE